MTTSDASKRSLWRRVRDWMEKVIDVKVKAVLLTGFLATFTVVAFQYQVSAINADRFADGCEAKVNARDDLRDVLFHVVDLSDVLPGSEAAQAFTLNRIEYINEKYPALDAAVDC